MNHDRPQQIPPLETGTPDEEFEQLRLRFHERLRKEQGQLATLARRLRSDNAASAAFLLDIQAFAHRLRGAALVFGFQKVGDGAKALELAAIAPSLDANGQQRDQLVASAMQALASNLADAIGASSTQECR